MRANDPAEAMRLWWDEIDAAGIDAVVCNGRLSDDRGSIDGASLAQLQDRYPQRFIGLAPADLEVAPGETVAQCEHAVRALGLRGINIEALQDQFLFGTSYPFSSMREPVRATLRLPLPPAVMEKYLWGNGARLLKLAAGT
jgi:predicted TIM-barrel fold metal-dependent hydrolase